MSIAAKFRRGWKTAARHGGRRARLKGKWLEYNIPRAVGYGAKRGEHVVSFPYRAGFTARRVTRPLEGTAMGRGFKLGQMGYRPSGRIKSKEGVYYIFQRPKGKRIREVKVPAGPGIKVGYGAGRHPYAVAAGGAGAIAGTGTLLGRKGLLLRPRSRRKYDLPLPQQWEMWEKEHERGERVGPKRPIDPEYTYKADYVNAHEQRRLKKLTQLGTVDGDRLQRAKQSRGVPKVVRRDKSRKVRRREKDRRGDENSLKVRATERDIRKIERISRTISKADADAAGKIIETIRTNERMKDLLFNMARVGSIPALVIIAAVLAYHARKAKRRTETPSERFRTLRGEVIRTGTKGLLPGPRLKYPDRYLNRMLASPGFQTLGDPRRILPKTPLFLASKAGDIRKTFKSGDKVKVWVDPRDGGDMVQMSGKITKHPPRMFNRKLSYNVELDSGFQGNFGEDDISKGLAYKGPRGIYRYVKQGDRYGWKLMVPRKKKPFKQAYRELGLGGTRFRSAHLGKQDMRKNLELEREKLRQHENLLDAMDPEEEGYENIKLALGRLRNKVAFIESQDDPRLEKNVIDGIAKGVKFLERIEIPWSRWHRYSGRKKMGHLTLRAWRRQLRDKIHYDRYRKFANLTGKKHSAYQDDARKFKASYGKTSIIDDIAKASAARIARLAGKKILRYGRRARNFIGGADQALVGHSFSHKKPWKATRVLGGRRAQLKGRKLGWNIRAFDRGVTGLPMGQTRRLPSGKVISSKGGKRMQRTFRGAYAAGQKVSKVPGARVAYKVARYPIKDPIGAGLYGTLGYGAYRAVKPKRKYTYT